MEGQLPLLSYVTYCPAPPIMFHDIEADVLVALGSMHEIRPDDTTMQRCYHLPTYTINDSNFPKIELLDVEAI